MPGQKKPEERKIEEHKNNELEFDFEAATAQAIEACDGDLRAAVRSLIVANNYLTQELEYVWHLVSRGTRVRSERAGDPLAPRKPLNVAPSPITAPYWRPAQAARRWRFLRNPLRTIDEDGGITA
jgi:hypothetical protein